MKRFDWRGFVSIFLLLDFVVVTLSGIVLFIAPSGRVARDIGFEVLGLDKEGWELVHDVFGFAMIAAILFHLYFNWRIFVNYFRKIIQRVRKIRLRETIAAVLLTVFLLLSVIFSFPPSSFVSDLSEAAKYSWEGSSYYDHEETSDSEEHSYVGYGRKSVAEVAEELGLSVNEAVKRLEANGVEASSTTLIREIMDETGMTSEEVIELMKEK